MDIRNIDVDNVIAYLVQKGYKPEQIIEIFELAVTAIKIQNNMCHEVKFNEIKNEVLVEEIINAEIN